MPFDIHDSVLRVQFPQEIRHSYLSVARMRERLKISEAEAWRFTVILNVRLMALPPN